MLRERGYQSGGWWDKLLRDEASTANQLKLNDPGFFFGFNTEKEVAEILRARTYYMRMTKNNFIPQGVNFKAWTFL